VLHLTWHERARVRRALVANVELSGGLDGVSVGDRQAGVPMVLAGTPFVADALESLLGNGASAPAGAGIRRHASAFFQANRFLLRGLVNAVAAQVPEGPVVDLYAGVGLFALALASDGRDAVTAVEGDRVSGTDLSVNAGPFGGRVSVSRQAVEEWLAGAAIEQGTTVIVDPPRTGLSRDALEGLLALRPSRVVYVSCDVATLARDVRRAIDVGYRVSHLEAFDLFPNTAHVETLAVLVR
jgi:23S rRNA (uracil1939-C5)-methyltransferase